MTSPNPNYLPKAPFSNTITLVGKAAIDEFEGKPQFSPQKMDIKKLPGEA